MWKLFLYPLNQGFTIDELESIGFEQISRGQERVCLLEFVLQNFQKSFPTCEEAQAPFLNREKPQPPQPSQLPWASHLRQVTPYLWVFLNLPGIDIWVQVSLCGGCHAGYSKICDRRSSPTYQTPVALLLQAVQPKTSPDTAKYSMGWKRSKITTS